MKNQNVLLTYNVKEDKLQPMNKKGVDATKLIKVIDQISNPKITKNKNSGLLVQQTTTASHSIGVTNLNISLSNKTRTPHSGLTSQRKIIKDTEKYESHKSPKNSRTEKTK